MKAELPASLHGLLEERVLILTPGGRDAAVAESILGEAGLSALVCPDVVALVRALDQGVGLVCLTEEALRAPAVGNLTRWIAQQPPWSDLPVIVLTHRGSAERGITALRLSESVGNVMLLDRPFHSATLVSLARTGLRARRRQYDARQTLADLQAAAAQLKEADRRKNEFLATLAHELRNPLAPLRNVGSLLRRSGPTSEQVPLLEIMERQIGQLRRLVEDLLEVSRITQGKIGLKREPMTVSSAVYAALEATQPLVEQRGQVVEARVRSSAIVDIDAARITQVVTNLLNNASKFSAEGGTITLEVFDDAHAVLVRVRDDGIGIAPNLLPQVFDLFAQGTATTVDQAQGGLGIGLSLVKRLVELHGGGVQAESEGPGKGACFTVQLPRAPLAGRRPASRA